MDGNNFWIQMFYPMDNFIEILFAVFIALLTERFMKEFEKVDMLGFQNPKNKLFKNIANFIIRFLVSFCMVFAIIFIIILIISVVMAITGFILITFNK